MSSKKTNKGKNARSTTKIYEKKTSKRPDKLITSKIEDTKINITTMKQSEKAVEILLKIRKYLKDIDKLSMLAELKNEAEDKKEKVDPFRILIGTVLSVRNKDESTIIAVKRLFDVAGINTPQKILEAPLEQIEELIKKAGMYKTKAKRLKEISRMIIEEYDGLVPKDMDELVRLPGVGRKVAGCVLVYAYDIPAIPVDTHVHRISNRLGFCSTKKPEETEQELMKIFPKKYWTLVNDTFVIFGKVTCRPISPNCKVCPVNDLCPKIIIEKPKITKKSKAQPKSS
ncbi:MAG: endonuclease III domain-containing protein [Promethearchaeota archaeon]